VRILIDQKRHLDLYATTMESTRVLFANDPDLAQAAIMKKMAEFWRGRVEVALDDRGVSYDVRDAAFDARISMPGGGPQRSGWCDPYDAYERARALGEFRADPRFAPLCVLFKRVANILKAVQEPLPALDAARLVEPAEKSLAAAVASAKDATAPLWTRNAYADILPALLGMESAIHTFFDDVLVNTEDAPVRLNRLRLLTDVRDLFVRGWDLSKVVVEGEKATV
jgi:glycyl-tRNA synthetase beta chain